MFVNPTASWESAFKLLGSQGLKGITDNVNYYRGGSIDKALKSGIFGSPWQVDYKKGFQLLTDPTLFKGPNLSKEQMKENVKRYKQQYKQAKENGGILYKIRQRNWCCFWTNFYVSRVWWKFRYP